MTRLTNIYSIFFTFFLLLNNYSAYAEMDRRGKERDGGSLTAAKETIIELYLKENAFLLKKKTISFLALANTNKWFENRFDLPLLSDSSFEDLIDDIKASRIIIKEDGPCQSSKAEGSAMSTQAYKKGSEICAAIKLLAKNEVSNLESIESELVAYLIHEIVHHFGEQDAQYNYFSAVQNIYNRNFVLLTNDVTVHYSFFLGIARGVVGCIEKDFESFSKIKNILFDETGSCFNIPQKDFSIHLADFKSQNYSIEVDQYSFKQTESTYSQATGDYNARVTFLAFGKSCQFDLKVSASDEDILINVENLLCSE